MLGFPTPVLPVILVLGLLALPGCVVSDIHEEMVQTNATLSQLDSRLELIEKSNDLLDSGNEQLISVHERLETVHAINETLKSIDASLKALDSHLASLRKTINKIPFVSESDDPVELGATPSPDETDSDAASAHVVDQ